MPMTRVAELSVDILIKLIWRKRIEYAANIETRTNNSNNALELKLICSELAAGVKCDSSLTKFFERRIFVVLSNK